MYYWITIVVIIFLLIPEIVLVTELYKYDQFSHARTMSLVISNFTGFFPASQSLYYTLTKQQYMVHEFILFYLITFNSGSYHLCNKLNYVGDYCTYLPSYIYQQLDFINSYFCIIATILYLAKFEFMNDTIIKNMVKFAIYIIEYIVVMVTVIKYIDTQIPTCFTALTLIPSLLFFANNRERYVEKYFNYYRGGLFITGLIFALIAFITYVCISINHLEDEHMYWVYHSYLWHIPVLLAPVFIFESSTICEKSFFKFVGEVLGTTDRLERNYTEMEMMRVEVADV